ncbi:MAG: glycosyltransferase, partial [Sphingobacteriales bacterium]
ETLMQQSKILLHPSAYEGFGMVCAEALAAGAQVISFCKPMDEDFDGWHIVKDKQEMIAKTLALLHSEASPPSPQLLLAMEDTARRVLALYGYGDNKS